MIFPFGDKTIPMPFSIQEVKSKYEKRLLNMPGIVSVGIGRNANGNEILIVGLDGSHPDTVVKLPKVLKGFQVQVEIMGSLSALEDELK